MSLKAVKDALEADRIGDCSTAGIDKWRQTCHSDKSTACAREMDKGEEIMENISKFVLTPLMIGLLLVSFNEKLRKKILDIKGIAALEKKLAGADRYYWPAFWLIMAAGVFVRCYRFVELPMGINQDGTMAAVEAFSLLRDGVDQHGVSWPTYFEAWGATQMSTLYSWLMIPFVKVLGLSKLSLRLPMLLVCLAMLPLIWDFARRIAGRNYALLVLLITATNPWNILMSRWALEANLMPHVLLTGVYLLMIGREKRWALYLSMVFFALTPYAYGVACFSVPPLLVFAAIYYLARRKANLLDVLVCVAIFIAIGGPYFYTMAINAFGLETAHLGPITMPLFEKSHRSLDMAFTQENPYLEMVWNLMGHFGTYLFDVDIEPYSGLPWTNAMYLFMPPVIICGIYRMWSDRRKMALLKQEMPLRDGGMLILIWWGCSVFSGSIIGGVVNRNNVVFYPLIMMIAWALYQVGKRLKTALAAAVAMILVSFIGLNITCFTDETYNNHLAGSFHDGLNQVLSDTWDWDYDRYYLDCGTEGGYFTFVRAAVRFAHKIDHSAYNEDTDLTGPDGEPTGWYFTERYAFVEMDEFEPDPMECAVYIIRQHRKELFPQEDYLITDYGPYAAVYPRYWAE